MGTKGGTNSFETENKKHSKERSREYMKRKGLIAAMAAALFLIAFSGPIFLKRVGRGG